MSEKLNVLWENNGEFLRRLEGKLEETARWLNIPTYLIKGKRIRAISSHLSCEVYGVDLDTAVLSGYVLELIHAASLVHDDIVDDAQTRRGGRTLNFLFSTRRAVLIGDLIFTKALRDTARRDLNLYLKAMSETVYKMSYGQYQEDITPFEDFDEHLYLSVIYNKTASLYELAFASGPLIARSPNPHMAEAGKYFGMAFQILDDCDDYEEDEGKPTLPHIYSNMGIEDPHGAAISLAASYLRRTEWELDRAGVKGYFEDLLDYMWSRI